MKKSELTEIIKQVIKETIRKVDGKYVVYPEKGGKRLGTHSTKKAAEKQLTAIHLNKESFTPSPLQNLVNDYLFFITMNFTHLEKTGKSPQDVDALTQMIKQARVDVTKLKDLTKEQLEKNRNNILQRIHDMLTYIISRMKNHMKPEEYEKRRDRLTKLLALYKDAAKVQENYADGEVKGKSRLGRVKKAGASCKGSVTDLRAKAKKYGGEKGKMYHWCANMKGGKK
jgi:hypothetical protein